MHFPLAPPLHSVRRDVQHAGQQQQRGTVKRQQAQRLQRRPGPDDDLRGASLISFLKKIRTRILTFRVYRWCYLWGLGYAVACISV